MKNIILKETHIKNLLINENLLLDEKLPPHIIKHLNKNKTSLGKHPAFPSFDDNGFDKKITLKRFNEIRDSLLGFDDIGELTTENLTSVLSKLVKQCHKLEAPIKDNLEKICFNTIIKLFNVPEDVIDFSCELVSKVNIDQRKINLTPEESGDDEISFNDVKDMQNTTNDVYKRRLIDALIVGASMYYTDRAKLYIGDIYELNTKLPELYSKIIKINNYLLFIKNENTLTEKQPMQGGNVTVTLGNDTIKTNIQSQGILFPILLSESIKGFMEVWAAHGLPEDKERTKFVIKKADFMLAELWDMRMGYTLWQYLLNSVDNDDTTLIPVLFSTIVELPNEKFHNLMQEVFAKTKEGKNRIRELVNEIEQDLNYDVFQNTLDTKRFDVGIIEDDFIHLEELIPEFGLTEGRGKIKNTLKYFKDHTVPLTDEEKKICKDKGAYWGNGSCGVHKATDTNGKTVYFCYTHRAWNKYDTIRAACKGFEFIETTA